tara:strand:- start:772 stop:1215 length:444 start_codon:yes stop_codon:yes gene_type:complete
MSEIIQIGITKIKHNPIEKVTSIEVLQGKGIKGDRTLSEKNDSERQLTLIESENIDYYNEKYNLNFSYVDFRRNLITKNIKLNELVGKNFVIGKIKVKGIDLCRPCKELEKKLGAKNYLKEFLRRGGLVCEILNSGIISVGDEISIL